MMKVTRSTSASAFIDRRGLGPFALIASALFLTTTTTAHAADVDCPTASEEGQRLRDKGRYVAARDMFRTCARDSCPSIVSRDCTKWLSEIEEGMPSIVVAARDSKTGADLANVRVLVDDQPFSTHLDGQPVAIDPGEHVMRFEADGYSATTQKVIVRVGERNRLLRVELPSQHPAAAATTPIAPDQKKAHEELVPSTPSSSSSSSPVLAYVLGGVGITAIGGGIILGLISKNDLSNLKTTCAPFCNQSDLDSVKTRLLIADVALGVGIVAVGAAAIMFFTHSRSGGDAPRKSARLP